MKKAINKTSAFLVLAASAFSLAFSNPVYGKAKLNNPIEIKFLSRVNEKPLFRLNLNNLESGSFHVKIRDGFDNIIYTETLKGKRLFRNYLLNVDQAEFNQSDFKLVFEITNAATNKTFVYNVTKSTRYVEDILIAKM